MSNQFIKYHKIASIEMLEAYRKGKSFVSDSLWMEQLIQKNPMVKAVSESLSSINVGTVKSISRRTSKTISEVYFSEVGFWSKFGVWIGLSSIALIIGLALFYQENNKNVIYKQTTILTESKTPKKIPSMKNYVAVLSIAIDDKEKDNNSTRNINSNKDNKGNISGLPMSKNYNKDKMTGSNTEKFGVKGQLSDSKSKTNNKYAETEQTNNNTKSDNTRSFESEANSSENQLMILSVQKVQILAKTNPKDFKSTKSNNNDNPLQTFGNKTGKSSSYSMNDVPKFTGGDAALQDYFVGKLSPIKIKKEENHFDRNIMIDLEINSHGKLKDYKIYGNLNPIHQKALIQAIKDLPRFSKGSENVVYSIGISF